MLLKRLEIPKVQSQPMVAQPRSLSPSRSELTEREVGDRRQSVVAHVQAIVPTLERSQVLNGSYPETCDRPIQSQSKRRPQRVTSHRTGAEGSGDVSFQPRDEEQELASFQEHRSSRSRSRRAEGRNATDLETPTLAP